MALKKVVYWVASMAVSMVTLVVDWMVLMLADKKVELTDVVMAVKKVS